MTGKSAIGWTERTWNPTTGCKKISPGCKECYANVQALKLQKQDVPSYKNGFKFTEQPSRLDDPLRVKKPCMWFVNSMSDLGFEDMRQDYFNAIMDVMAKADWHIFQVLTKRPDNLRISIEMWLAKTHRDSLPDHIWIGVSVENADYKWRIDRLWAIPTTVHFLSIEPLIAPVGNLDLRHIEWVICGGESGENRRPFNVDWAREVRDQCTAAKVPFFYKQGGARYPGQDRTLDGRTWDEFPQVLEAWQKRS